MSKSSPKDYSVIKPRSGKFDPALLPLYPAGCEPSNAGKLKPMKSGNNDDLFNAINPNLKRGK